ncbi:MAG: hypothetical protein WB542_08255 [Polaromonas sp.]
MGAAAGGEHSLDCLWSPDAAQSEEPPELPKWAEFCILAKASLCILLGVPCQRAIMFPHQQAEYETPPSGK